MDEAKIGGAIDEAVLEAWAEVHSEVRDHLARLCATSDMGEAISDGYREFFRLGYLRGHLRAIKGLSK